VAAQVVASRAVLSSTELVSLVLLMCRVLYRHDTDQKQTPWPLVRERTIPTMTQIRVTRKDVYEVFVNLQSLKFTFPP
jgi:hypothetical protein